MAWEHKKGGAASGYYYLARRWPDRPHPKKIYLGRGAAAHQAAAVVEKRRQDRHDVRVAIEADDDALKDAEQLTTELQDWLKTLISAWMILTGHYVHHRSWVWRKKMPKPRVGSRKWEESLHKNPNFIKETLKSLTTRAASGNAEAREMLGRWLEKHPELKPTIRQLDDLCTRTENAWISAAAFKDKLREDAVRDEVEKLKAELLGEKSSLLERLLVSNVIVSHVANQRAAQLASQATDLPALSAARDRRVESSLKRLHLALKTLAMIRDKTAQGIKPSPRIKILSVAE